MTVGDESVSNLDHASIEARPGWALDRPSGSQARDIVTMC